MVIIMDMSTGKKADDDESVYNEEVLNAGWLPQPELGLQLQSAVPSERPHHRRIMDPDDFLKNMYLSQE